MPYFTYRLDIVETWVGWVILRFGGTMPDRDVFNALPRRLRAAARSLLRASHGEPLDALPVAEALNHLTEGGVPCLGRLLKRIAVHEAAADQASFQGDDFAAIDRTALRQACSIPTSGWREELLCQAAIHAYARGVHDPHSILRDFVMRILNSKIIHVKGGVETQLRRREEALDAGQLEARLSPLLDVAASRMARAPQFTRLGLASKFRNDVDLHGENLL